MTNRTTRTETTARREPRDNRLVGSSPVDDRNNNRFSRVEPVAPTTVFPDRSLDLDASPATVAARADGRHPWIFRKMVIGPVGPAIPRDGEIVRVIDRDGFPIGYGLWNRCSQIQIRLISRDDAPPGLDLWSDRIDRACGLRTELLGLDQETNAYRAAHAEGDGLSGLIVDRYADVLSIEVFSMGIYQRIGPIVDLFSRRLGTRHALVQVDERAAVAEGFSGRPVVSASLPPRVTIHEHGIKYRVTFAGSHKTGFFCDQRDNRRELARFCRDRSVLDLCCYSAGFGLNALIRGAAREVTCVDLDETAIATARDNVNANQARLNLVQADAFGYMRRMIENGRSFGVVVLDPPKLIPTRDDVASGKRKYFDMNALAFKLVEPGGLLLTCSCSGLLPGDEFLTLLRAAARRSGRSAQLLALRGASADHPTALDALEGSYLKAAWLRVGEKTAPAAGDSPTEVEGERD